MITKKEELIKRIEEKFSQWDFYIRNRGTSGLYDIHKQSENYIRDILNTVYGYDLKNLGKHNPNFPIIDLGDSVNGLCFQVTANKSDQVYAELENRFLNSGLQKEYPKIHVFILAGTFDDRKGLLRALKKTGLTDDRVLDFTTILNEIRDVKFNETAKLDDILSILDKNHISYTYFDHAISEYKTAAKKNLVALQAFTAPSLIEQERNPLLNENRSDDDINNELRFYSQREISKKTFNEACRETPHFILTGDAGSGKSEVLKDGFFQMLSSVDEYSLPIYVDLNKQYAEKDVVSLIKVELDKYIKEPRDVRKQDLIDSLTRILLSNNTLTVFIDGYDEMERKELDRWNENIDTFLNHYSGTKIVIAARRNRIFQDVVLPIKKFYSILPFDDDQMDKYITALLIDNGQKPDPERISEIKTAIKGSRLFQTAPTLIVKMLIQHAAFEKERALKVPQTKSEAYRNYFRYIIEKKLASSGVHDAKQTLPSLYRKLLREAFRVLSELAFSNFNGWGSKRQISYGKLNSVLTAIENKNANKYLYKKGIDFFSSELQILREIEGQISFNHFTYQEFFLAVWLKDRIKPFSKQLQWIRRAYLVPKYNQVFIFLVGLMSEAEAEKFFTAVDRWPWRAWVAAAKTLDYITLTKFYFICEMAAETIISETRKKVLVDKLIGELNPRNDMYFERACKLLGKFSPGSVEILDKILKQTIPNGHYVRREGLMHYALPYIHKIPEFKSRIIGILNEPNRHNRGIGIDLLRKGRVFDDAVRDKILELHFLPKDEDNDNEGFRYMTEYAKQFPEKCVEYAERYLKKIADNNKEHSTPLILFLRYYFASVTKIPGYNETELREKILNYLDSRNVPVKDQSVLIRALSKTGIRQPAFDDLLLKKLDKPTPLAYSIFMHFRDLLLINKEVIHKACEYLYSNDFEGRHRAMNYLADIRYDGYFVRDGHQVRIASRALEIIDETLPASAYGAAKSYAVQYLGNIKYTENDTCAFLIKKYNDEQHSNLRDQITRYLMNIKYYSSTFFHNMFNSQVIDGGVTGYSWESNLYFENIENYLPTDKIKDAQKLMGDYFMKNNYEFMKLVRNRAETDDWALSHSFDNYRRTALALQKLLLNDQEREWASKLV